MLHWGFLSLERSLLPVVAKSWLHLRYGLWPCGSKARICSASSRPSSAGMTAGPLSPCEPRRHAYSRCVEVREDPGPHLPPPCKALFHREEDDIVPPVGPLLGLFPRGKKVDVFAEGTPDGLNGGHVLSARVHEHEGDHRYFRADFLHPLGADSHSNLLVHNPRPGLDADRLLKHSGQEERV